MPTVELEKQLQELVKTSLVSLGYHGDDREDCEQKEHEQLSKVIAGIRRINNIKKLSEDIFSDLALIPADIVHKSANIGSAAQSCIQRLDDGEYTEAIDNDLKGIIYAFLVAIKGQAQANCEETGIKQKTPETPEQIVARLLEDHIQDLQTQQERLLKFVDEAKALVANANALSDNAKKEYTQAITEAESANKLLAAATSQSQQIALQAENIATQVNKVELSAEQAKLNATTATETANGIIPNMLAILGIFVSIVFAIVACYLSVILTTPNGETAVRPLPIVFLSYLLMGHIMSTVVFLLLYLISRLSGHSIQCRCSEFELIENPPENVSCDCDKCKYKCSTLPRFRLRYAYFFAINIIFLIGYILLGIWQVINLYYREWFDNLVTENPFIMVLLIVLFIFSITSILVTLFRRKKEEKIPKTSKI